METNLIMLAAILVVGVVSVSASVVYFKSIKSLLSYITVVSEIGKEERASLLDRIQATSFAELKHTEVLVHKAKNPAPQEEPGRYEPA